MPLNLRAQYPAHERNQHLGPLQLQLAKEVKPGAKQFTRP